MTIVVMTASCPECAAPVKLAQDVEKGEIVQCAECGAELEVFETSRKRKTGVSERQSGRSLRGRLE